MGRRKLGGFTSLVNFRKTLFLFKSERVGNLQRKFVFSDHAEIKIFFPKNFWALYDTVFSNCYVV